MSDTSSSSSSTSQGGVFRPAARAILSFFNEAKSAVPTNVGSAESTIDNSFKTASKAIVNSVDIVGIRDNYRKATKVVKEAPPALVVASATLLPILLFKKVPSVKDPALGAIGFCVSMYYCYPELISRGSKKVLEVYKEKRDQYQQQSIKKVETPSLPTTTNNKSTPPPSTSNK
ncbi:hypothetical protein DFA_00783 [Cavenderia fasciculata]|uniref:Uncharacterized protein n=1 Tax=Cavenderia fasciculata TaxID=261658 RepID=F4PTT7_CACFS|nr:uncharacterized protein DFA_00783 [Cavenderia fasciculata]EGG20916.1 hypothetical protein DFA_00783 [Cavenderia fasciculata]|eukprot:XP_004358766.1 hypothetical protein DFA_00783 [Cavenderia fasciculata]